MIYLDNASTTQMYPEVIKGMLPYMRELYGNAGSVHKLGTKAKDAVNEARFHVAEFLHCDPGNIIFTSGATEGNNTVLYSMTTEMLLRNHYGGGFLFSDGAEHDSVLNAIRHLQQDYDMCKVICRMSDGVVNVDQMEEDLRGTVSMSPCAASIMYMNNETGAVNDVARIGKLCNELNVIFHTDITQAAGFLDVNVKEIGCSYATMSAHKIHGPKGVGAIYFRDDISVHRYIHGGAEQEFGLRGGTENVPGIVGFGIACELASKLTEHRLIYVSSLRQKFILCFKAFLKSSGYKKEIVVHCDGEDSLVQSKIASIYIPGIDGETLVLFASSFDVCISAGSACCSRDITPSHVLLAMGCSEEEARQTIRVSFSELNTEEEVIEGARILANCVKVLMEGMND